MFAIYAASVDAIPGLTWGGFDEWQENGYQDVMQGQARR